MERKVNSKQFSSSVNNLNNALQTGVKGGLNTLLASFEIQGDALIVLNVN